MGACVRGVLREPNVGSRVLGAGRAGCARALCALSLQLGVVATSIPQGSRETTAGRAALPSERSRTSFCSYSACPRELSRAVGPVFGFPARVAVWSARPAGCFLLPARTHAVSLATKRRGVAQRVRVSLSSHRQLSPPAVAFGRRVKGDHDRPRDRASWLSRVALALCLKRSCVGVCSAREVHKKFCARGCDGCAALKAGAPSARKTSTSRRQPIPPRPPAEATPAPRLETRHPKKKSCPPPAFSSAVLGTTRGKLHRRLASPHQNRC